MYRTFFALGLMGLLMAGSPQGQARGDASGAAVRRTQAQLDATVLRVASTGPAARIAQLLRSGASPDARDGNSRSALTVAALAGQVDVARVLVAAGADPDAQDDEHNNALLVTGETGDVDMLRVVLTARPDLTRTNRYGGTALIPAADRGHLEYVREILRTTRINVNHVNHLGWTALLEAVILGDGGKSIPRSCGNCLSTGQIGALPIGRESPRCNTPASVVSPRSLPCSTRLPRQERIAGKPFCGDLRRFTRPGCSPAIPTCS
ncbi:ankyrin repeat domain-containing protein [Deinococcus malanensis]|uniref:ankyrin repeat domain-containing protein n=1 Tax=Deinococcus malanensis TaxID=1706855 RepID=UPI00362B15B7